MFRPARRQNRLLTNENRIQELLNTSEYGFLSLGFEVNEYSYGIPISYAYDSGSKSLYFHSALEGQKIDILKQHKKVSFCVVGKTSPISEQFTTLYESVHIFGDVCLELTDEEKSKSLMLLVEKYSPEYRDSGEKYMNSAWNRTLCFKVTIKHISAKAKY